MNGHRVCKFILSDANTLVLFSKSYTFLNSFWIRYDFKIRNHVRSSSSIFRTTPYRRTSKYRHERTNEEKIFFPSNTFTKNFADNLKPEPDNLSKSAIFRHAMATSGRANQRINLKRLNLPIDNVYVFGISIPFLDVPYCDS